ncbi:MAG: hypothetical protein COU72_00730 [Parcubacteria group bacterium CG10_big_fil_rev_8_21_14_0_10_41_35]|nr:MAG: hypothetical protein COU72_00730 [Parcubacteria group bacterium CG10_big_fil_rev_8_21_14_0_10_41_35]
MQNIIIDTDPGKDDFLAILMLILSKQVNIKAITTVMGNSSIRNVTANAKYLLDITSSQIQLYPGAKKPLKSPLVLGQVMGSTGLDGIKVPKISKVKNLASSQIISLINQDPDNISILALGPQTNLAMALNKDKNLAKKIMSIVFMGGAITAPGNKNRVAEFNYFIDPEAAKIVMESRVPKIMIPLDLCYQVPLFIEDFYKLEGSKYGIIINKLMKPYIKAMAKYEEQKGAIVYDALAAYYLLNPDAFTLTPMDIVVETKGEFTKGMCVQNRSLSAKTNIMVATDIDKQQFKNDFIKIINSSKKINHDQNT